MIPHSTIPIHVGIIMDGNRRWAKKHHLKLLMGHRKAAYETIEPLVDCAIELGISHLTLWAFSTENWQRDKREVDGLLKLFRQTLSENIDKLHTKGVRVKTIGDTQKFPADIYQKLIDGEEKTKNNKKITVIIALNYGGRDEIIRAIKKLFLSHSERSRRISSTAFVEKDPSMRSFHSLSRDDIITEEDFNNYLDTAKIPDPDLIIRTGGEQRMSGFLMWQSEYSEFYFTDVLFPDFTPEEFKKAITEYQRRKRRFGR